MYKSGDKKAEDLNPPPKGPAPGTAYLNNREEIQAIFNYRLPPTENTNYDKRRKLAIDDITNLISLLNKATNVNYKLFKLLQAVELLVEDGRVVDMLEDDPNVQELIYCWDQFKGGNNVG